MNLSQRLRTCAKHTGLDAVIELLTEAADEIDRLSAQPADVTDDRQAFEKWLGIRPCGAAHDLAWSAWKARAIIALRPVQVPMTDAQITDGYFAHSAPCTADTSRAFNFGVRFAEAHHGITAQAKKEAGDGAK